MDRESQSKAHVATNGSVTLRQRPTLLLMKVRLHAAEATLELGLANVKKRCDAASRWLQRLEAHRIEFGEPHFTSQNESDPMKQMRAVTALAMGQPTPKSPIEHKRELNVILTAMWNIAAMSAEEVLVFLDRLQFEATTDPESTESADPAADFQRYTSPEEKVQQMMAHLHEPQKENRAPQFLFITQLTDEQLAPACHQAFNKAYQSAERLAQAAGMRLGKLQYVHYGHGMADGGRTDRLMDRQRCYSILAGSSYMPGEYENISDDPRSTEFNISVNVSYDLK